MTKKHLDLVIFGATGFTGKNTVKLAAYFAKDKNFTWGIAGRRKEALKLVLKEFAQESESIPKIVADIKDQESLQKMTYQTKVLINCCGPYRFYGEPIIKACIINHTHYVDVSGEPQFIEKMQLKYSQVAQEAGIYIISACGFDSIPADLGLIFTQDHFKGDINSVEMYLNAWTTNNVHGAFIHYGTWESAVYGLAYANELHELRTKLFPNKLPEMKPKLKKKGIIHRSVFSEGWSTIFPGSDRSVCLRTQRFLFEKFKQRPIQVQTYVTFKSLFQLLITLIIGGIFNLLTKYKYGRNLLLQYPKFFSGGYASCEGPKLEVMENTHFSITFIAKGWTNKLLNPTDQHIDFLNKEMITKVTGVNPGYGVTCKTVLISAIMILKEFDKMPDNGGVFAPGAAFRKTSIIDELNKHNVKFEVISSIEK